MAFDTLSKVRQRCMPFSYKNLAKKSQTKGHKLQRHRKILEKKVIRKHKTIVTIFMHISAMPVRIALRVSANTI